MRKVAGILLIIGGVFIYTIMRAVLGHAGWLGTLLMVGLIGIGITILSKKR